MAGPIAIAPTLKQTYALQFPPGGAGHSPVDATDYYIAANGANPGTVSGDAVGVLVPRSGTIKGACFDPVVSGTLGSSETTSAWIQVNGVVGQLISSAILFSATHNVVTNQAMNVPVVAGDRVQIKMTTATWGTNPTTVFYVVTLLVEVL